MSRKMVILTEGKTEPSDAKTAVSVTRYKPDEVFALIDSTQKGKTIGELLGVGGDKPIVGSLSEIPEADTLLIGIAPSGGKLPEEWRPVIKEALEKKMTVLSGLHHFLSEDPEFSEIARKTGASIIDVRKNTEKDVALRKGINPACLRLHTVGTDCNIGKMVTSIEVCLGLQKAGLDAKFVATGQTGILIEGDGCPIDCVVSDFVNGAAEKLVLKNQNHQILVVEGQGSLFNPMYSSVTLGLLHGLQPHGLILCYELGRKNIFHFENLPPPSLSEARQIYETMANLMFPCKVIGIAMNSRLVSAQEAINERERVHEEQGLPVTDVFRFGSEDLIRAVQDFRQELLDSELLKEK